MALTLPVATHERLAHLERGGGARNAVEAVEPESPAARAGVRPGDLIVAANGEPLRDIVDWRYQTAGERVELRVQRDGAEFTLALSKEWDENPGIVFAEDLFDRMHLCKNKCVFCFLYQQPKGLRPSLYIKDDDFRLSFLHANYVTLTNLKPGELERICAQRLSPMYVSVHATDPEERGRLLGRRGPEPIVPILATLAEARIQVHAQIVLCPGYNDGAVLERTIEDLATLHPEARSGYGGVVSVALVPIGITQFRERLAPVRTVSRDEASALLDRLEPLRAGFKRRFGTRFLYPSDEFYLNAGRNVPPRSHYEGFPQLEDGVGLVRLFLDDLARLEKRLPTAVRRPRTYTLVTGEIAAPLVQRFADALNRVEGLHVDVCVVHNWFFEGNISVAGLLVGRDIVRALEARAPAGETVVLPSVVLRDGEAVFLDEMTLPELARRIGRQVRVVERMPSAAARALLAEE